MFMELVTWVEGSDVYQCWFNKKKFIKILNQLGISDWKFFLYNYTADDTQLMMDEFEKRGWQYKKINILFQIQECGEK